METRTIFALMQCAVLGILFMQYQGCGRRLRPMMNWVYGAVTVFVFVFTMLLLWIIK